MPHALIGYLGFIIGAGIIGTIGGYFVTKEQKNNQ